MSQHEAIPAGLEYETPQPRPTWLQRLKRSMPNPGWAIVLGLYPLFVFWLLPSTRRTSGSSDPLIHSLNWAFTAVALRAAIALARRERTWHSLLYLALYVVLPLTGEFVWKLWRSGWWNW